MPGSKRQVYRLLDANMNRAREGLRVAEDAARFFWKDALLYRRLRRCRHELHRITEKQFDTLIMSRDSEEDAGRLIPEGTRSTVAGVVAANMWRAEESLRVLEEYGKLFSSDAGAEFKRIRFQLYTLEKELWKKTRNH
jgi:thiamine-phosphate pyrophosphorylase